MEIKGIDGKRRGRGGGINLKDGQKFSLGHYKTEVTKEFPVVAIVGH